MSAIPQELRDLDQWVCWRYEEVDGRPTKIPYRSDGSGKASSTDPTTWSSYQAAVDGSLFLGGIDGIGFVFSTDDPYVGIDLDDLEADAAAIILALASYTEHSVSGRGAHVIVRANLNGHPRKRQGPLEVYGDRRYFVFTGNHMKGTPETIEDRQEQLERVLAEYLPAPEPATTPRPVVPVDLDDQELLERMFAAKNGDDIRRLWDGDLSAYDGDHSRADLALCGTLAFWTGRDPLRIERMFSSSALGQRKKWQRDDYRARTIEAAIGACREVYKHVIPARESVGNRSVSSPPPNRVTRTDSLIPDIKGNQVVGQSVDGGLGDLEFESLDVFADEDEPGADPLLGDADNIVIAENDDVLIYGDGGAGKTTLANDLAVHLAAGDDWLGIRVPQAVKVGLIENEGPRPLYRRKMRRKRDGWKGSPLEDRIAVLKRPWGKVSVDNPLVREKLAAQIRTRELDVVIIGPVIRSGMNEAGTLKHVADYLALFEEVRTLAGRRVTFILIHHENRAGTPSGAWEGAVSTLIHVQAQGHGRTRLHFQKARWGGEYHKQTLLLGWADGESFTVIEEDERDDNTVCDEILAYVRANGGTGWNKVVKSDEISGQQERLAALRDQLLEGGRLVNRGSGKKGAPMKLWHSDDPALPPADGEIPF